MICSERMCLPATTIIFSFQFLPFVYWTNRDIKRCHKVTRWEEEYRCCAVAGLMLGGRMLRRYRLTLAREAIFCSCAGAVDRCASKLYQRHGCQVPTRRMKEKKQQQRSPNHTPNNTKNLRGKRNGRYNSCFFSLIVSVQRLFRIYEICPRL
jgi:hypothetical protein